MSPVSRFTPSTGRVPADDGTACTFAQKALARAAGLSEMPAVGSIVTARPEVVLSHDNTAAIVEIWRQLDQARVAIPDRLAITLDHAVPAPTPRHAANHAAIRRFVAEQGIRRFYEAGRGICHQVLSEEAEVSPGDLILGADSHTPHFGWLGAFGAGIGRTEVAALWATGELWLTVPDSLRVCIEGELSPWVSAKDLALTLIGREGADGALYRCVEFSGACVDRLGLSERMVLANMMAEFGAKASYLAPTGEVFEYLADRVAARKARESGFSESDIDSERQHVLERLRERALYPDPGAPGMEIRIDASRVQAQVSCPHTVDRTMDVSQLGRIPVDQAFLGTCTNGRLEDLELAHRVLRGRRLSSGTRLLIVPASSQIMAEAAERGWLVDFVAAGAMIGTPGCGPCMGNHMGVLAEGEVCISSANRNFRGRMGTRDAEIYLASPAVVAASAVAGRICSPEEVVL